jgi:hypothetical protein
MGARRKEETFFHRVIKEDLERRSMSSCRVIFKGKGQSSHLWSPGKGFLDQESSEARNY